MSARTMFETLAEAAGMAPSSDNTQPWLFSVDAQDIRVWLVSARLLDIDVHDMYSFISIGAAIENLIQTAARMGYLATPDFSEAMSLPETVDRSAGCWPVARISLQTLDGTPVPAAAGPLPTSLSGFSPTREQRDIRELIHRRHTDRQKFSTRPLPDPVISELGQKGSRERTQVHWITDRTRIGQLVAIDSAFSRILLSHPPLFDGLFNTVRFNRRQVLEDGWGMDVRSLDLPFPAQLGLKLFGSRNLGRAIARWGIGPAVARGLSKRLSHCGALCLISARSHDRAGFLEAGRSMQAVWLAATEAGLAVHPYGVITQYLHMARLKPQTFPANAIPVIMSARPVFMDAFAADPDLQPMMMLRLGYKRRRLRHRLTIRLALESILKTDPLEFDPHQNRL